MNRFSQGPIAADVQSNFVPLPVDAIARQIERKQNQYDLTKAQLDAEEQAVLGVKGMSQDRDNLVKIQNQYSDEILKGIEEVGGDYSRLGGLTDVIGRKLRKDLTQGHLGSIQANYLATQGHIETLNKMRESGRIGDRGYNLGMKSISDFAGTVQNPDGSYSRADLYTPVKEESLAKMAQDRAKASADQYTVSGDQYKTATTVAANTYNNLMSDESAISNAREEVISRQGKLTPEKEALAIKEHLWNLASNAGNEAAFYKHHTPTERELANKDMTLSTFDINTTIPYIRTEGVEGTEYTAVMPRVLAGIKQVLRSTFGGGVTSYKENPDGTYTRVENESKDWDNISEEELAQTRRNIENNIDLKDVFKSRGYDISKMNSEELSNALKQLEEESKSSRASRVTTLKNKGKIVTEEMTGSDLMNRKITVEGVELTGDKKAEAVQKMIGDKPEYSQTGITTEGYIMPGSIIYYGDGKNYIVETNKPRTPQVYDNAITIAHQTGFYKYPVGSRTVTMVPERYGDPKSPTIIRIDGKLATQNDLKYLMGN